MQNYYNNIISTSGKPVQGASILVTNASDNSTATIYSDNGVTTTANPLTSDQFGRFNFYAADGRYNFSVTANGVVAYSFSDVIVSDTYDNLSFTDTGILGAWSSSSNSYNQIVVQNKNSGSAASAELAVYNNAGTATTNYLSAGINSSGYTGTGAFNAAGAGFVATGSTDLAVGTFGANKIHFVSGLSNATDAMTIDGSSNVLSNVNASAPALTVNSQMVFSLTSNTNLRVSVRGTDGVTRVANLTLA